MSISLPTLAAAQLVRLLPRPTINRLVGNLCEVRLPAPVSRALVAAYCRAYRVDLSDTLPRATPFASFDEFFTRPLAPGTRPICSEVSDVACPADGVLQSIGTVEPNCRIRVKGRAYNVARLTGDEDDARECVGGQYAVVYLSPRDYHRVHAPVDADVVRVRAIAGEYYPVNALGERCAPDLLVTNRRVAIVQQSPELGRIILVMVAALIVGRITLTIVQERDVPVGTHSFDPPVRLARGEELGAFHLGSTVVLLTGPQAMTWQRAPGLIRVGESLTRTA